MKKELGAESLTEQKHESLRQRHMESAFEQLLGFEPVEAASGRVVLRLPFTDTLLQSFGRVHGGALFSLADHASGWEAYSMLDQGERCAPLEMKINYIAAVHDEDCIAVRRSFTAAARASSLKPMSKQPTSAWSQRHWRRL